MWFNLGRYGQPNPRVPVVCIYEGIDEPGETGIQTSFGIVESPSLTPKTAYAAVQAWIAAGG